MKAWAETWDSMFKNTYRQCHPQRDLKRYGRKSTRMNVLQAARKPDEGIHQRSPDPLNKGFSQIHDKFMARGWELTHNTETQLAYTSPQSVYDEFLIRIEPTCIVVSVPVANSNVAYKTTLPNYFEASEFLQAHLEDFYMKNPRPRSCPTSREHPDD